MNCRICETRRPRRYCPGVGGDICSLCCGTHREITVDCPLDCPYLQDAHRHEKPPQASPEAIPNQDIEVSESFLAAREGLVEFAGRTLFEAAAETPGVVDYDVRDALEALVRTYRTLESGLVYESRPTNPIAAVIHQRFRERAEQFQQQLQRRLGMATLRSADMLGVLVFFQRIEFNANNGRKRGRAFLGFLADHFSELARPQGNALGGSRIIAP